MSSVCRICLGGNKKLYSLENNLLIDVYEKLSSSKFNAKDARPRFLCCFCYRKLMKCHTFSQIADRSEKIFTHLCNKGLQVTHEYIAEVNLGMKPELTVAKLQFTIIGENTTNAYSQEIIKYEPIPIVDIKEEITAEQDEWADIVDFTKREIKTEDNIDVVDDVEKLSYSIDDEETKPDDPKIMISCNTCSEIFFSESQLVSHIRNSHFQLKGRQESCTKQYTENTSMNKGKINHIPKKTFDCNVCGKEFVRIHHLNRHIRTHTRELFPCNVCDKKFKRKIHLVSHMIIHTGENPFACNICAKKFKSQYYLGIHMRTHTKEKPVSCDICDQSYKSKQYLVIHMRNHTGEKPYVCNVCDKQFKQNGHLISHMRIHTGEKPFACKVCDKQFSHKKSLDIHMISHTESQPFACNECKKQYKFKPDLVRHIRTHTGCMPFACNLCKKQFNVNRDLVRHMRKHTKETPFSCKVCNKKFSLKCNLVTHLKLTHRDYNLVTY